MNINATPLKTFGLSLALVAVTYYTHAIEKNAVSDDDTKIQTVAIESEPGLKPFIDRYIAAVNARDSKRIKAMTHPKDLEALIKFLAHKPADYKDDTLKSMLLSDKPVPKNHTPFIVRRYLPGSPLPEEGLLIWTIRPTHTVEFTYEKRPRNEMWVFINLVRENDHWFLVGGVPDPDIVKNVKGSGAK